jgi:hypothetical protein
MAIRLHGQTIANRNDLKLAMERGLGKTAGFLRLSVGGPDVRVAVQKSASLLPRVRHADF